MAHFVIGWLRNTSYYLFGSGSSGLGKRKLNRVTKARGTTPNPSFTTCSLDAESARSGVALRC